MPDIGKQPLRAVDADAGRHYVTAAVTFCRTDERLRLLLHLLALIAGFNGLIAGPAAARASEPAVISASVSGSIEQASESVALRHAPEQASSLVQTNAPATAVRPVFTPQAHRVDERRIE